MIGAIIGDIAGSVYEFKNEKNKAYISFFGSRHDFTDDSVLTFATADWLLHGGNVAEYYAKYGNRFPRKGYGGRFRQWLCEAKDGTIPEPYNSLGNGSAMRVSPCGWISDNEEEVLAAAKASAECTHNHPAGIRGAQAIALCILMARQGKTKEEIEQAVEGRYYSMNFTCDAIRPYYGWQSAQFGNSVTCKGSVPVAIRAFLDSKDFVDCMRTAISLGGDSDTIAAMAGGIAEAFYGVPKALYETAMTYLPEDIRELIREFDSKYGCGVKGLK